MKKLPAGILTLFLSFNFAFGASNNSKVGTKVYPFLKNGIGARPLAMGGAFTGLSDDESALYYNPAGISGVRTKAFAASYVNYFGDVNSGYLGFLYPLGENQTAGAALNYFNYGTFVGLDSAGNSIGNFTPGDLAFQLTYARRFPSGLSLGLSSEIIYEKIQDYSSSALALDLGLLYNFAGGRGRAGVALQHLGFQISSFWNAPREGLPTVVKVGGSIHPVGLPMNVALDIGFPADGFDFAIRMSRAPTAGTCWTRLFGEQLVPVCSPAYRDSLLDANGTMDLRRATLIHVNPASEDWQAWLDAAHIAGIASSGGLRFDTIQLAFEAASAGLGVALGRRPLVDSDLASGALVEIGPEVISAQTAYWLVSAAGADHRPDLSGFRQWLLSEAGAFEDSASAAVSIP